MSLTHLRTILLLASGALAASAASAEPRITNGSFESPAYAADSLNNITGTGVEGWTGSTFNEQYIVNGNIEDTFGRLIGTTPFGSQYLGLNAIRRNSFRAIESQIVTGFTIGQAYALTLYWANLSGAPDAGLSVVASDGDTGFGNVLNDTLFTLPVGGPYGTGAIDFRPVTIEFTALSNAVTFSIGNQSLKGTLGVDNVSLRSLASAVPEPATWATMIVGVGAVGGAMRRRKNKVTTTVAYA